MISINIKRFRKSRGISQEEIAVKLGVVRQTVSKWENGLSVPDTDVLIHMAELLGVSVSQLLGIETENNSVMDLKNWQNEMKSLQRRSSMKSCSSGQAKKEV